MTAADRGDGAAPANLRKQIHSLWSDLAAGRIEPDVTRQWALAQLDSSAFDDELDIRGVLYLHGPADDRVAVARALAHWECEVSRFDEDPEAWMHEHCRVVLRDFARRTGREKAARFGRKLVRHGHLTDGDVDAVLRSLAS